MRKCYFLRNCFTPIFPAPPLYSFLTVVGLHFSNFFFLWSFSSIFPTICDEFYESKNTNVFYSIFSFKWDPWWSTFVSQFFVYRISALGLQDSFIGFTRFLHWVYKILALCLHDSVIVFTWFLHGVYRIISLCLHDSFIGFTGLLQSEDYMIRFTVFINHIDYELKTKIKFSKKSNFGKNNCVYRIPSMGLQDPKWSRVSC